MSTSHSPRTCKHVPALARQVLDESLGRGKSSAEATKRYRPNGLGNAGECGKESDKTWLKERAMTKMWSKCCRIKMAMVRTDEVARGEDELVVEHPLRLHIEVARRVQRDHLVVLRRQVVTRTLQMSDLPARNGIRIQLRSHFSLICQKLIPNAFDEVDKCSAEHSLPGAAATSCMRLT